MVNLTLATYKAGSGLMRSLPPNVIGAVARQACRLIPRLSPARRHIVERNLERSLGRKPAPAELDQLIADVFSSYARYYTDTARLPGLSRRTVDDGFEMEGFVHIQNSVAAGNGTILVLPHVGGWEWAGSWLAKVPGYDVSAVVEPIENEELRQWMGEVRRAVGMDIMPIGPGIGRDLLSRLKRNEVVCLMSDRNLGDGGVEVDFFGETTELPGGAATLALRTGASIVPVGVYHRGEMNHAVVLPAVPAERDGRIREDVQRITQQIAVCLEELIRGEPTQWLLLQPNWPSDHRSLEQAGLAE